MNADYKQRIVLSHHNLDWVASPTAGVERRMLDRIGDEVAKATTIVRYQPGSQFESHTHEFGEEILVLDEHGRYPSGAWIRSPHMSMHQPFSQEGCTIFVKTGHLLQT